MILQTQPAVNVPTTLPYEQLRRVEHALANSPSENTCRHRAGRFRYFRARYKRENYFLMPAFPEMAATYIVYPAAEAKNISTVRPAVAAVMYQNRLIPTVSGMPT